MPMLHSILVALHVLAAIIWVGGMFFAYMMVRPAMGELQPPDPVKMWGRIFDKFFNWVWLAIIVLLGTGYGMLLGPFGGFADLPLYLHVMQMLGLVMVALFTHLYFAPWKRLKNALAADDYPIAAKQIPTIRRIVAINLTIGLVNAAIGAGGRYLV
jgi:uncharacterized membrane protein